MHNLISESLKKYDVDSRDKILLAISGGLDSTVLLHLILDLGFLPELAHVNFQLRGSAADEDEAFCKHLALRYHLKFHQARFDTANYAEENKLSTQMAARTLRYGFFEELDQTHNYRAILTAHHGDDQLETMIFKLGRGSALEAIAGIREKRQKFLRPMLGIFRKDIESYARERQISWREDRSNAETKYLRNAYRHRLIPLWEDIQADLKTKMMESGRLLREQSDSLNSLLDEKLEELLVKEDNVERLAYTAICRKAYFPQLLHRWLSPKGNWDWQAANHLWQARKGRFTENEEYRLYKSEECYELRLREDIVVTDISIEENTREIKEPRALEFSFKDRSEIKMDGKAEHLFIDADMLKFPLKLRTWRDGDRFQPLGMSGSKKLSDYWIDIKLPMAEKAQQLVLENDGEIVGLLGHRIDHRYRLKNSTKTVYFVRLKK